MGAMIRYVCSWCGKECGSKPSPDGVERESHSICRQCRELQKPVTEEEVDSAMDRYWYDLRDEAA